MKQTVADDNADSSDSTDCWIQEGKFDSYLNRWVVDLVYSEHAGNRPVELDNPTGSPSAAPPPVTALPPETTGGDNAPTQRVVPPVTASADAPPIDQQTTIPKGTDSAIVPSYRFAVYLDEEFAVQWFFANLTPGSASVTDKWFPERFGEIHAAMVHLHIISEGMRVHYRSPRTPGMGIFSGLRNLFVGTFLETLGQGEEHPPADKAANWNTMYRLRRQQPELRAVRWMLAEAISRGIAELAKTPVEPDKDIRFMTAMSALQTARTHLNARSAEVGRFRLLKGAAVGLLLALVAVILFGWLYCLSPDGLQEAKLYQAAAGIPAPGAPKEAEIVHVWWSGWLTREGWDVLRISFAGALGAMLSLLVSAPSRTYDAGAMPWLHFAEGICRIAVGILGAFFLLLAIKCKLLGTVLVAEDAASAGWMLTLVAILAGFSERLVPAFAEFLEAKIPTTNASTTAPKLPVP